MLNPNIGLSGSRMGEMIMFYDMNPPCWDYIYLPAIHITSNRITRITSSG